MDVRDTERVQYTVDEAINTFGKIDGLVNNAAGNFICAAEELTTNGWNSVVDIVLNGTWHCTQAVGKNGLNKDIVDVLSIWWPLMHGVQGQVLYTLLVQKRVC